MKGVESIIASILLIIIALAILSTTFYFLTNVTESTTEEYERIQEQERETAGKKIRINKIVGAEIIIKNVGSHAINRDEIVTYLNGIEIECTWSDTYIDPAELVNCFLNDPCLPEDVIKITAPGNFDASNCDFVFVDAEPPLIVDILVAPPTPIVGEPINISANVSDNVGVDSVTIEIDQTQNYTTVHIGDYYYNENIIIDEPDEHAFKIFALDVSGLEATETGIFTVKYPTIRLDVVNDSHIVGNCMVAGCEEKNYGGITPIYVGNEWNDPQSFHYRAILRFNTSIIPENAIIINATLNLYLVNLEGEHDLSIYRILKKWNEGVGNGDPSDMGDVSWDYAFYNLIPWNIDGADLASDGGTENGFYDRFETPEDTVTIGDPHSRWVEFNVTNITTNWYTHEWREEYGFLIIGNENLKSTRKMFRSKEYGGEYVPNIRIIYKIENP
ncbi:DNRLRE domain-containing protein [Candidatus Aenigmatarchaeota archaeon]